MNTSSFTFRKLSLAAALACASVAAQAAVIPLTVYSFSENFEGSLVNWFDRNPASPDARIVIDPLNAGNRVLAFNTIMGAGSVFTGTTVSSTGTYTLSFDYLGLPGRGGNAGDLGGYIGVSIGGHASSQYWIGGTGAYATPLNLIDDGIWRSYSFTFNNPLGQPLRVMVEDWDGSYGVAGDAFFDNIVLRDSSVNLTVPEPGSLTLAGLALLTAALAARRRTRG